MRASITVQPRSRNGHAPSRRRSSVKGKKAVQNVLKTLGAPFLMKLLLRKSVLIAIGLGTLVSWFIKRRFFRA